eukprot:symbB.v1.2.031413.t1/scaffold3643.1/size52769/5
MTWPVLESHQWKEGVGSPRWSCSSVSSQDLVEIFNRAVRLESEREKVLQHINASNSAMKMLSTGGVCLLGYINALAILLRLALDVKGQRCDMVLEAVEEKVTEWLQILLILWRSPNIPLLLLDSSPWPFRFNNISEILAEATHDRSHSVLWRPPSGGGRWKQPDIQAGSGYHMSQEIRIWSFGLHATLAMEPESIWKDLLVESGWRINVELVLAENYCNRMGRCTKNLALADLLKRHVRPRDLAMNGLNRFPHVPDVQQLQLEFQEIAQADEGIHSADLLMCTEPPFFCQMFRGLGKPILGYFGNPFGAYLLPGVPQETFYKAQSVG